MDLYWWSIEVLDGPDTPSLFWRQGHGGALTEAAITNGAYDWNWHHGTWGVVFEIAFASDERWHVYRDLPAVRAALDAVPDPVNGLLIHPGRGGSSASAQPRRPRPVAGAGGAEVPHEPEVALRATPQGRPPAGPPLTVAGHATAA
jgi:hypothetical protein